MILIAGESNSGKTTVRDELTHQLNAPYQAKSSIKLPSVVLQLSLAEPVKRALAAIENYAVDSDYLYALQNYHILDRKEQTVGYGNYTRRELMIALTNALMSVDSDFWWNVANARIGKILEPHHKFIIIDDFRYPSAFYYFLQKGFQIITLAINDYPFDGVQVDFTINNSAKQIEPMREQVIKFLNEFRL
jgi:hypothetical protein